MGVHRALVLVCVTGCTTAPSGVAAKPKTKPTCSSSSATPYVLGGLGVATAAGTGYAVKAVNSDCSAVGCAASGVATLGILVLGLAVTGSIVLAASVSGEHGGECEDAQRYWAATGGKLQHAQQLANTAAIMARRGSCEVAIDVSHALSRFDEPYTTFIVDPAVARCMAAAVTTHAAVTARREECRRARRVLHGGDCFDPATVTLETVSEMESLLQIDRTWRLIDRAATAAGAGRCEPAIADAAVARATHAQFAAVVEQHAGIAGCIASHMSARTENAAPMLPRRDACRAERAAKLREAQAIDDVNKRGEVLLAIPACDNVSPRAGPAPLAVPPADAWGLFARGRASAAVGLCKEVRVVAAQLLALDRAFHDEVFVRVRSIARCL